jgi:hypothetical protein
VTKWALNVVNHLFTKEELRNGTLEPTSRSNRNHLSPTRVRLLRGDIFLSNLKAIIIDYFLYRCDDA